jgi:hypothetical protein
MGRCPKIACFHMKALSSLTLCLALPRLHVIKHQETLKLQPTANTKWGVQGLDGTVAFSLWCLYKQRPIWTVCYYATTIQHYKTYQWLGTEVQGHVILLIAKLTTIYIKQIVPCSDTERVARCTATLIRCIQNV